MPDIPERITFYWTEDKIARVPTQTFLERYRQRFADWCLEGEITQYDADDLQQFLTELVDENNEIPHEFPHETDDFHSYEVHLGRY